MGSMQEKINCFVYSNVYVPDNRILKLFKKASRHSLTTKTIYYRVDSIDNSSCDQVVISYKHITVIIYGLSTSLMFLRGVGQIVAYPPG